MQPNSSQQIFQAVFSSLNHPLVGALILFFAAMICMIIIGNPLIVWLQNKQWKKGTTADETWAVREDTPDSHQKKKGTPSMGGIGIIAATLLSCIALLLMGAILVKLARGNPSFGWSSMLEIGFLLLLPATFLSFGFLGFADDWSKATGRGGLTARHKFLWQVILGTAFVCVVPFLMAAWNAQFNPPDLPFQPYTNIISYIVLVLVLVTTCNATNLTDGIDGLAAGLMVQSGIALLLVGTVHDGFLFFSDYFCLALAGACFGFLFFNKHPARVFMGDTGSLAIGAALGAGAILQGAVFLLPFIGFIYFVEMFSVIAQVAWFKWTKRKTGEGQRLFRRAPLHHHFEMGGWSEWRVVGTFWAVNLFTSAIGLWLWHAGVLPRWP